MELITRAARDPGGDTGGARGASVAPIFREIPRSYVRRQRIIDRLDTDASVTLVLGPAGTGKSVAVAGWAAQTDLPLAWVSVVTAADAHDSFWQTIADALRGVLGDVPSAPAEPLLPGDAVLDLVARLQTSLESTVVLVIDNYHTAEDAALAASMTLFLRHAPPQLRVVLLSRRTPLLPLDRMRVTGELCEITVDELRFSPAEAGELVEIAAPEIDPRARATIVAAADGWVAALRLCLHDRSVVDFGLHESDHQVDHLAAIVTHLEDFVLHEVLASESEALVRFLSDISVVPQTSIALAAAITDQDDAEELLELAVDRGLFIERIIRRGHFEIHPVVRRVLLATRERRAPDAVTACRERAARWLERTGNTQGALEQWLQAGDQANALRLLAERHVQLYDAGDEDYVRDLLAKLKPAATSSDVGALIDLAWCQMITDVPAFRENVGHAMWWAANDGATDERSRQLHSLQALVCLSHGDFDQAEAEAHAAIDGHPSWNDDPIVRTSWNDIARAIALSERWDDDSDETRRVTVLLRRDPIRTLALESTRALGMALAGCPVDALRIVGGIRHSAQLANMTMSTVEIACAEVIARRELGDAPDAESELERLINADPGPLTYTRGLAATELVQLHLDRGSISDATRAFYQLERIVAADVHGQGGRTWLGRMGTVLSIEAGDHAQAITWSEMVDDPFWGPVGRARALGSDGPERAGALLDEAVARSPRHAVILAMLRAANATDPHVASTWTESAVEVASANNLLQTLASVGEIDLIERIAWRLPSEWMDRLRRATTVVQPGISANLSLVEPLTVRERDVLRFLPSRLTLKEIAAELYVSVNTLKFHLKVIYRKLGVNSRAEAAELARSWGRIEQR
jgi:LuxR family maltose regulon positive regulatory protein